MKRIIAGVLVLLGGKALAFKPRPSPIDPSILRSQTPNIQVPATFTGLVEARPTLMTRKGSFTTENYYEISWWPKPNQRLTFGETLFSASTPGKGQTPTFGDGYFRYQFREIKKVEAMGLTVSVDVRANLPISKASKDAGLITALRSTVLIARAITPSARFEFRNTPIVYFFKAPGHQGSSGAVAHPIIENRTSIGPVISITPELTLMAPVNLSLMKYRKYANGALHENELQVDLSFSPELDWAVNPNLYLGLAYRTEALIVRDQIGLALSDTAGSGYLQFVMGVNF